MKLLLLVVGKTDSELLRDQIQIYEKKLNHYLPFSIEEIQDIKIKSGKNRSQLKEKEAEALLRKIEPGDTVWLLDEKGSMYTSVQFAEQLQKYMNAGPKRLVMVVGGAFGFSEAMYERAQAKVSLSKMTFNHQMIRLFIAEQLYRACTILRNEPYHNE